MGSENSKSLQLSRLVTWGQTNWKVARWGLLYGYVSLLIGSLAIATSHGLFPTTSSAPEQHWRLVDSFTGFDGLHYESIVADGYQFITGKRCNSAFFPGYPLVAGTLHRLSGLPIRLSLVLVSWGCLLAAFVAAACYLASDGYAVNKIPDVLLPAHHWALVSLAVFPTSIFFRVAHSESLFLLLLLLVMLGLRRGWSHWIVALIAGAAAGTRPVGVCLAIPIVLSALSSGDLGQRPGTWRRLTRSVLLSLVAGWGLWGYMLYDAAKFNEPLAFAKAQQQWTINGDDSWATKLPNLLAADPISGVYRPSHRAYWKHRERHTQPLASLHFANPIYFLSALALLILGKSRKWLKNDEWLLGIAMLLVPYLFRAHEMGMAGMGRFVVVIVPMHMVIGTLLARIPPYLAALVVCPVAMLGMLYAVMFAAWYPIF